MAFDVVGKLHVAGETKQVSERFSKREFVLEVADGKYPQFVSFQLTGDRVSALDDHQVGDQIRVTFNLRGREWKNPQGEVKYFNSLDVWKLESARQNDQRGASAGTGNGNGGNGGNGARRASNDDFAYRDDPRPGDLAGASGRDDDLPF
jgi:single-strand DNA-binding protein